MTQTRDCMDIERVIEWAYRIQQIDKESGSASVMAAGPARVAAGGLSSVIALGCRVDTPSAAIRYTAASSRVNEDASIVDQAVMCLPAEACVLVIQHGRTGSHPDYMPDGVGEMEPIYDGRGRMKHLWRDERNRNDAIACLVRNTGASWAVVEYARAQYSVWYEALVVLYGALSDKLERIDVLPPSAPSTPWMAETCRSRMPLKISA